MENKKKIQKVVSILVIALVLILGVSYAALSYERTGETQELIVGDIWMKYTETNELVLENAMPSNTYDSSKYFEFTISGKNTYEKENIIYEIKLNHGDEHATRTTRLIDNLLKFTLVEIKDGNEEVVVDGISFDNIQNQRLWISTIPMNTTEEIETTYRLYMWISLDTNIGNTSDADYDMNTWNNDVYASIKVNVTGDFNSRVMRGEDGQYEYAILSNGKIQLSKYLGTETDLVIPASYDGYDVYSVGNLDAGTTAATRYNIFGLSNSTTNTTIKSITIEDGIEVLEMGAFSKCTGLKEVNLPDTLKVIGHTAFNGCTGLTGDLVIPEGVEVIDIGAFQNCNGFNGTLTLPSTLKTIGQNAFFKCTKLTGDLIIPEGVTTLQKNAFNTCSGFNGKLQLPSTLKVIGEYAFTDSTGLTGDLIIPEGVVKIEESAFQSLTGMTGNLTLPSTLEEVGPYSFAYTDGLTGDVVIPNSVKVLGEGAFNGCTGFNGTLTLSNNLESIGDFAFNHCSGFKNTTLNIPNTVKTIGSNETDATHVFYDFATKTIESYTINNLQTSTGEGFKVVDGIIYNKEGTRLVAYPANKVGNTYTMPEGITIIDELAFSRAGSVSSSIGENGIKKLVLPNSYVLTTTLPSNYLNKGNNLAVAIYNQTSINEIAVNNDNPNYQTVDGVLYSKDLTTLWYVPVKKSGNIIIPEGVTTIKSGALYATNSRTLSTITIPASVTTIESSELNELKSLGTSKVIFAEGSIFEFKSNGTVGKK